MLAEENGDHELAKALGEKSSQHRLKTIYHLTGGNHRLLAMLSTFLTVNGLSELVDPFVQMADRELTPYYQQRLDRLSPQQYKIIQLIADQHGQALRVNDIASRIFLSPQIVSRQLHDVLHEGYVRRNSIGRESYYELNEPLLRLILDIKQGRNRPLPIIVNFLRNWYTVEELWQLKDSAPETARIYYQAALKQIEFVNIQKITLHDISILSTKEALEEVGEKIINARDLLIKNDFTESLNIIEDILIFHPNNNSAKFFKILILINTNHLDEASNVYDNISSNIQELLPPEIKFLILIYKISFALKNNNLLDALKHCEDTLKLFPNKYEIKLMYTDILFILNRNDEGFHSLKELLQKEPINNPVLIDEFILLLSDLIDNVTTVYKLFPLFNAQYYKILQQGLQLWIQKQIPLSKEKADKLGKVYQALQSTFNEVPEMKPIISLLLAAQGYALGNQKALMDIPLELRKLIAPDSPSASA
jgi:DNA-binding transcriptional ArsR family regulator